MTHNLKSVNTRKESHMASRQPVYHEVVLARLCIVDRHLGDGGPLFQARRSTDLPLHCEDGAIAPAVLLRENGYMQGLINERPRAHPMRTHPKADLG